MVYARKGQVLCGLLRRMRRSREKAQDGGKEVIEPRERWEYNYASVNLGSSTISRVVEGDEDKDFKPYKVGFTAELRTTEKDENESA